MDESHLVDSKVYVLKRLLVWIKENVEQIILIRIGKYSGVGRCSIGIGKSSGGTDGAPNFILRRSPPPPPADGVVAD